MAKQLAHMEDLVIAKIDATKNDIEGIKIEGFPTLMYFGLGEDQEPVKYQGNPNKKGILKFLKNQMGEHWKEAAETPKDL